MQLDLFEWIDDLPQQRETVLMKDIAYWSYGVVKLDNGDMLLAEICWDENDQPLMYCEPHLTVDQEEGVDGIIKSLEMALKDLAEEPDAIPVSAFYTYGNNGEKD